MYMNSELYKLNYRFRTEDQRDYIYKPLTPEDIRKKRVNTIIKIHNQNQQLMKIPSPRVKNKIYKNKQVIQYHASNLNRLYTLPNQFSLINKVKTVLNQGQLGSCVSNSFAQYILMMTQNKYFISRIHNYYCSRLLDKLSNIEDTGLDIRSACKTISKVGYCLEENWPYNIQQFDAMPPLICFQPPICKFPKQYSYIFITGNNSSLLLNNLKNFLYQNGRPIIFGFNVYDSFFTKVVETTGMVPFPNVTKESFLGGHCMLIVGYDENIKRFICLNCWGKNWGAAGYCYIQYDYLTNSDLAGDFCGLNITI